MCTAMGRCVERRGGRGDRGGGRSGRSGERACRACRDIPFPSACAAAACSRCAVPLEHPAAACLSISIGSVGPAVAAGVLTVPARRARQRAGARPRSPRWTRPPAARACGECRRQARACPEEEVKITNMLAGETRGRERGVARAQEREGGRRAAEGCARHTDGSGRAPEYCRCRRRRPLRGQLPPPPSGVHCMAGRLWRRRRRGPRATRPCACLGSGARRYYSKPPRLARRVS